MVSLLTPRFQNQNLVQRGVSSNKTQRAPFQVGLDSRPVRGIIPGRFNRFSNRKTKRRVSQMVVFSFMMMPFAFSVAWGSARPSYGCSQCNERSVEPPPHDRRPRICRAMVEGRRLQRFPLLLLPLIPFSFPSLFIYLLQYNFYDSTLREKGRARSSRVSFRVSSPSFIPNYPGPRPGFDSSLPAVVETNSSFLLIIIFVVINIRFYCS